MPHSSSALSPLGIARLMGSLAAAAPGTTIRHLDVGVLVGTMASAPAAPESDLVICTQCEIEEVTDPSSEICDICIRHNEHGPTDAELARYYNQTSAGEALEMSARVQRELKR